MHAQGHPSLFDDVVCCDLAIPAHCGKMQLNSFSEHCSMEYMWRRYDDPSLARKVNSIVQIGKSMDVGPEPSAVTEAKILTKEWLANYNEIVNKLLYIDEQLQSKRQRLMHIKNAADDLHDSKWGKDLVELMDKAVKEEDVEALEKEWKETYTWFYHMKELFDIFKKDQTSHVCAICNERLIDTMLEPCAHTMCNSCVNRIRTNTCPFCRAEVQSFRNMFINGDS